MSTPTVFNGWEQVTQQNVGREGFNLEPTQDFMPGFGPMAGYAVTLVIQLSRRPDDYNPDAMFDYLKYLASVPTPTIAVVQDLDKPQCYGSAWGEVFATIHRAFGCVGTITDGGVRDIDEMAKVGFKVISRHLCVGHGAGGIVDFNCPLEVFGRKIVPGQFIHADKHGFLAIPPGDENRLFEAAQHMDASECETYISTARDAVGKTKEEIIASLRATGEDFEDLIRKLSNGHGRGEW
ncbi:MAG TPA: RraA family protein [Tepidisphaeraceae bacterium]|nr:RraA family protein [Tepidisphaeraceae bacterium]